MLAQVILDTLEYGSKIKKTPVVVGNCTGFAVNRVFFPYTQAACMLLDLGLDPYSIDKAIALAFGMPMGPFRCVSWSRTGLFVWSRVGRACPCNAHQVCVVVSVAASVEHQQGHWPCL